MKNKFGFAAMAALAVLTISGCQSPTVSVQTEVMGRGFYLQQFDGKDALKFGDQRPYLEFRSDGRVLGHVCNQFSGNAVWQGSKLRLEKVLSTLMLCPERSMDKLENGVIQSLMEGVDVQLESNQLILKNAKHTLLYRPK